MTDMKIKEIKDIYITDVPLRSPRVKAHLSLNDAKLAVGLGSYRSVRGGQIWKFDQSRGNILLYDIEPGTPKSNLPWKT